MDCEGNIRRNMSCIKFNRAPSEKCGRAISKKCYNKLRFFLSSAVMPRGIPVNSVNRLQVISNCFSDIFPLACLIQTHKSISVDEGNLAYIFTFASLHSVFFTSQTTVFCVTNRYFDYQPLGYDCAAEDRIRVTGPL